MTDPGDEYLQLLVRLLDESRRLVSGGRLRDPESLRELAALEMEATTAQFRSYLAAPSGNIVFLPNRESAPRLSSPVRAESRRLRSDSARLRARAASLRASRRPAAGG